jgi:nucleoside-diphosphate-sugar epimerase
MKTFITGGTGFIGSRLALRCLEAGDAVTVLGQSRNPVEAETVDLLRARGAEVAVASVGDRDTLAELMQGTDVVYHLAAAQHEANVPDEHFRAVNVEGTRNVLDASTAAGVKRVVHGSSIGVYGWRPGETVSENSPLEPDNIYGVTKLEGEEVVRSFEGRVPWVIVRIAETYGPGDRRLLKLFRGIQSGTLFRIGPCQNLHHLIQVEDLVDGLQLAASQDLAVAKTLVLGGRQPHSTREVFASIAAALGKPEPKLGVPLAPLMIVARVLEGAMRPLGIQPPLHPRRMDYFRKSFAFHGDGAREVLGFSPRVELDRGMAETAAWYREEGLL